MHHCKNTVRYFTHFLIAFTIAHWECCDVISFYGTTHINVWQKKTFGGGILSKQGRMIVDCFIKKLSKMLLLDGGGSKYL